MTTRSLTNGQRFVLGAAAIVMVAVGAAGAVGTFSNVLAVFHREATAIGVVAAGEGLTLILALTMLGLTMLGQPSPAWVRGGLWGAPLAACLTGLSLASTLAEAAVYGLTPLGMSGAAEGLGLIARRIVTYTTGVDADEQRRQADDVQQLAYHQAAAERHPDERDARGLAADSVGSRQATSAAGDQVLGASLVEVQRERITGGADTALGAMYGGRPRPAVQPPPLGPGRHPPPRYCASGSPPWTRQTRSFSPLMRGLMRPPPNWRISSAPTACPSTRSRSPSCSVPDPRSTRCIDLMRLMRPRSEPCRP